MPLTFLLMYSYSINRLRDKICYCWQKVSTLLMGQLRFTLGHWGQFADSEGFYPTFQRPGWKSLCFWTLVDENIALRKLRECRVKGEGNVHIFLLASLGERSHWDCRAGSRCNDDMASEEKHFTNEAKAHLLCLLFHVLHTHCKVCVCALKLCHRSVTSHV